MNLIQKIQSLFQPMLSCEQVNEFIIDYLEDQLPKETRAKFEMHLKKCPKCGAYFDQYNTTVTLVKSDGQLDVPEDLAEITLDFLHTTWNQK